MSGWPYILGVAFVSGLGLGGFYFGVLWLSVRRLTDMARPGLWMTMMYLLRTAVVLLGFYLVMDGRWQSLLAALAGFVIVRVIFLKWLRPGAGSAEAEPSGAR